jgi:hypothetical protein
VIYLAHRSNLLTNSLKWVFVIAMCWMDIRSDCDGIASSEEVGDCGSLTLYGREQQRSWRRAEAVQAVATHAEHECVRARVSVDNMSSHTSERLRQ